MSDKTSREDRLAAKLRENLRRRKAQGRNMEAQEQSGDAAALPKSEDGG